MSPVGLTPSGQWTTVRPPCVRRHVPLRNRCHDYRLYHLHCRLTTSDAPNGRSSGRRRGYGEGFKTGRHNHGDMARLVMQHDPQQHSWDEARRIVRKRWPPE